MLKSYFKFLSKNKLYSLVNVLGFAISLAFVLLLSIYVKQELSVDKFHSKKDRIYLLAQNYEAAHFANPVADLLKDNYPEIESYTRVVSRDIRIKTDEGYIQTETLFADSSFFNIFDFAIIEGDRSTALETRESAVITKNFAKKMFKDQDPMGKPIYINDTLYVTVKGIIEEIPNNTIFPKSDMVVNYRMIDLYWGDSGEGGGILNSWGNSSFTTFLLAKEGTDLPSKAPSMLEFFHKMDYWLYTMGFADDVTMIPLEDIYFSGVKNYMVDLKSNNKNKVSVYLVITILILVVAILNYINLSVSQASKRGKEAALKKLLGSDRGALIMQFVGESMIMTVLSFIIGFVIATIAEPFFNNVLTTKLDVLSQFANIPFLFFVILSVLAIGAIAGLIPAFTISSFKPIDVIKGSFGYKVKTTYSKILISFQYVVAISLLSCCVFITQQSNFLRKFDMGFNKEHKVYLENEIEPQREDALRSQFMAIPGVERVSFNQGTPFDGGNNQSFEYNGESMSFQTFVVDTSFFNLYNIEITPIHDHEVNPDDRIIWLNRKGYNALKPDPETQTFELWNTRYTVAGIIEKIHISPVHEEEDLLMVFPKSARHYAWSITIGMKASADPVATANEIRRVYAEFISDDSFELEFGDSIVNQWYESENKMSKVLIAFSILTMVILFMGILAMSLYYVQQKEKEIGIRKVNGATEQEVIRMLNLNFVRWIIIAFVISVPITIYAMGRWLQSYPYRISISWWVFALTGILILILSVILITLQSWKAATSNPTKVLKSE